MSQNDIYQLGGGITESRKLLKAAAIQRTAAKSIPRILTLISGEIWSGGMCVGVEEDDDCLLRMRHVLATSLCKSRG